MFHSSIDIFNASSSCFSICFFLKVLLQCLCFLKNVIFSAYAFICFWSCAFHPQFATFFFVLDALLSLQTKDNRFLGFRLTATFQLKGFCWIFWGIKRNKIWNRLSDFFFFFFFCGEYILFFSRRPKCACMRSIKLFEQIE